MTYQNDIFSENKSQPRMTPPKTEPLGAASPGQVADYTWTSMDNFWIKHVGFTQKDLWHFSSAEFSKTGDLNGISLQ